MNEYLRRLAARSSVYAAAFRGEKVPSPTLRRRELFCLDRGPLAGPRTGCVGTDPHVCHRYGSVVTHNGECQSCPSYMAED